MKICIKIYVCGSAQFDLFLKNQSKIKSNSSGFYKMTSKHIQ